ncbi:MAG: spermidine synthase, partial [Bryobacteraceae bacterium]
TAFSLFMIPVFGTQQSQRVLVALAGVAALAALSVRGRRAIAVAAAIPLAWTVPAVPWGVIAHGRRLATQRHSAEVLYVGEGRNASIAISRWNDGKRMFHVSGKVEASSEPYDMRLQRMLGHLPALVHPAPQSVLVVGFGAGVTAGTFVAHPKVRRIVICELEPMIPPVASRYFNAENHNVLADPRVEMVYDDARHYIRKTREKFDIITSDPIHPWVRGSAILYSTEYFQLVRQRLNPGGVITQWVPLYESDAETVKSELATFFRVFPHGTLWSNDIDGSGYDSVLMASHGPTRIDVDAMEDRLRGADHQRVLRSLNDVGFGSALELLVTYAGRASDLADWLRGAHINADGNLRLQYLAGMALNFNREARIHQDIVRRRRFSGDVFVGRSARADVLRGALESQ